MEEATLDEKNSDEETFEIILLMFFPLLLCGLDCYSGNVRIHNSSSELLVMRNSASNRRVQK